MSPQTDNGFKSIESAIWLLLLHGGKECRFNPFSYKHSGASGPVGLQQGLKTASQPADNSLAECQISLRIPHRFRITVLSANPGHRHLMTSPHP